MHIEQRRRDSVTVLDVDGPMTIEIESPDKPVSAAVRRLLVTGQRQLLLNLHGVPHMDSTGLGEIVEAFLTTARQGGVLKLEHLSPQVQELLRITRLCTVLPVFDSEAVALASFREPSPHSTT